MKETAMPEHHFETPTPIDLHVELGRGAVRLDAVATTTTHITVTGTQADQVRVEQRGQAVSIVGPRDGLGFRSGDCRLDVTVTLPLDSRLVSRLGSADLSVTGQLGESQLKSGSGDVSLDALSGAASLETGSGDVLIRTAGDDLQVKSGSGDVAITRVTGRLAVSTGSGDIVIEGTQGPSVVKTGSGDLTITSAGADASYTTGSGDLRIREAIRGRFVTKSASGDVAIAVRAGVPVWTDINTVSGHIHSTLQGAGQPEPGQDHVELRTITISGDVDLSEA
ncbi:MAG: DUF4097 domain-containing protein [Nocardioides sp.]|nr:DUF4097 domain-containing protein [Nocardioides sp.]